MGSRREEERNEKIIRGLMKLPPNRRCINCNSLGPQYVCTNFWTFVCMTCSGIHREFTHRVKSVSMAKFTSQEVEALQNGGNQRAREIYMKDWDQQRQKLPDNSKIDKIREFIKAVYVDRRYAGGRSEKPPRDMQIMRSQEETRRASSYHSYSQSPPYDYQYEDRRYGKQGAALTRKPGSDRGLYEGKVSNLIYSPGRSSEPMYEDRFANEGSAPRVSDYSVSSGGDTFRSGAQSPNFQKDSEFNSPRQQLSKNISGNNLSRQTSNTFVEVNFRRDTNGIPHAQRTASLGSFDSFGSNSVSIKSYNSGSLLDFLSESEQTSGNHQDKSSGFPTSTVLESSSTVEQFKSQLVPERTTPDASSNDLFKAAATSITPSLDLFQPNVADQTSFAFIHEAPQAPSSTPLDLFADFPQNQSDAVLESRTPELSEPKNEGWATFDSPNSTAAAPTAENLPPALVASNGDPIGKIAPLSSFDPNVDWHIPEKSGSQDLLTLVSDPWHVGLDNTKVSTIASNGQAWNAFGESAEQFPSESAKVNSEAQLASHNPPSRADHQYLGFEVSQDLNHFALPASTSFAGPSGQSLPSDVMGLSCTPLSADEYVGFKASKDFKDYEPPASTSFAGLSGQDGPPVVEVATSGHMGATEYRSTNPFDVPFSSDLDQSNMFLDMGSLQAALPNAQFPSTLLGSVNESWFPQDPLGPYVAAAPPGGLAYIAGQAPSSQMPNVPTQGPVASIGGNPFA